MMSICHRYRTYLLFQVVQVVGELEVEELLHGLLVRQVLLEQRDEELVLKNYKLHNYSTVPYLPRVPTYDDTLVDNKKPTGVCS